MKRNDILILVALFGLWLAWPVLDRRLIKPYFFPAPPPAAVPSAPDAPPPVAEAPALAPKGESRPEEAPELERPAEAVESAPPGHPVVLENDQIQLTLSTRGAGVQGAELKRYPLTADPGSEPVRLDFSARPALVYKDLEELGPGQNFDLRSSEGREVVFERSGSAGLRFRRTCRLETSYLLKVTDQFENRGSAPLVLPAQFLQTGPMPGLPGETTKGMVSHGVDTLSPGGEGVKHWGGKLLRWFDDVRKEKALPRPPLHLEWPLDAPVEWAAAKNKYFAQIVIPEGGAERAVVIARRAVSDAERRDPAARPRVVSVEEVAVDVQLAGFTVLPGESVTRTIQYYLGPKKYDELNRYGQHLVDVMEFGFWAPIGKLLLHVMNGIHRFLWPHNYGIAIILLTILIRVVFWPITHKSTESMRKMQEIQPLVNAVRQKYKDNAQKQQQEIMALYKEHKVNPLGGCLPMLIQIPVFIALFVVLRSAIELRFARFLWIRDLSQPENLFAGMLPFGLSLNTLPIIMAVTMAWQQKLTPSGGDPQQQKMMMFMPIMMLVLFYNFASGLSLYWTTNQCLMIAQQLAAQRRKKAAEARKGKSP